MICAAEVLARKRAATYQRLTMQLTLEALLSGARRMTPLRAQALLEPEDSSSSDFVESPEESSPEVSDSDGGNPSSGPDDGRGAGDSEASPSLTVTSGFTGRRHTVHSEKRLHKHTQNTSPKRTSTAGTQTRHVDIALHLAAMRMGGYLPSRTRIPHCIDDALKTSFVQHRPNRTSKVVMRRGKLGGSAFAGLEMMCSNGGIELALTSITFRRTLADRHAMEIAVEHLSIAVSLRKMSEDGRLQDPILRLERVCPAAVQGGGMKRLQRQLHSEALIAAGGGAFASQDLSSRSVIRNKVPTKRRILKRHRALSNDVREIPDEAEGVKMQAHSEKLHNHTQNTSPKRTSTAGT
ncbi:hypothetical protein GUITHDRAFT_115553 [Guillardia theta CCMP2712]|uniref:Uncharacterized protein n=1 Tax=Guillardia theta (strain CCMP2712) TaxID=905079 RepID=L1IQ54_GUITC|nr:hypothetical protein GUITHDRAFT_115553 [Guillardia theta CCMP2712]EKX38411.1 hypothetical protein GUITHDRAFT_115553 [Guillardia theta CCMP2712]|eukprot:XP_005825391.1 hypothetical protein GUITHDRAFT_115553 [Guillardia theta CCMP2712]